MKSKMINRLNEKARTIYCDEKIWVDAKKILDEIGLTRSGFISIVLKNLVESEKATLKEIMSGMVVEVMDRSNKLKRK